MIGPSLTQSNPKHVRALLEQQTLSLIFLGGPSGWTQTVQLSFTVFLLLLWRLCEAMFQDKN